MVNIMLSRRSAVSGLAATLTAGIAGPALAHKDFVVYFTPGSYLPTEDALEVLHSAAAYAEVLKTGRIPVTGHADEPGTDEENLELSKQRALGVVARLVELGIDRDRLDVTWKGNKQPAVVRSDPSSGPLNRRVTIEADYSLYN